MVDEKGENSYCRHPWAGPLGGQESRGFTHSAWELGKKIHVKPSCPDLTPNVTALAGRTVLADPVGNTELLSEMIRSSSIRMPRNT